MRIASLVKRRREGVAEELGCFGLGVCRALVPLALCLLWPGSGLGVAALVHIDTLRAHSAEVMIQMSKIRCPVLHSVVRKVESTGLPVQNGFDSVALGGFVS